MSGGIAGPSFLKPKKNMAGERKQRGQWKEDPPPPSRVPIGDPLDIGGKSAAGASVRGGTRAVTVTSEAEEERPVYPTLPDEVLQRPRYPIEMRVPGI